MTGMALGAKCGVGATFRGCSTLCPRRNSGIASIFSTLNSRGGDVGHLHFRQLDDMTSDDSVVLRRMLAKHWVQPAPDMPVSCLGWLHRTPLPGIIDLLRARRDSNPQPTG